MSARLATLLFVLCGVFGCNQIFGVAAPVPRAADAGPALNVAYAQCLLPSDCAPAETCLFEHCSAPCALDRDCPDTSLCLQTASGSAACVRLADNHCGALAVRARCPDGTRCVNERCSSLCDAEREDACLSGRVCEDGVCVLTSERTDAGTPGVAMNMHAGDAGPAADSGKAEPSDAGTLTSGGGNPMPDAGTPTTIPSVKPVCSAGEQRCTDNAVETCGQDARYGAGVPCSHQACIGGRCFGSCTPGEQRCANNAIETCDETGHFVVSQPCSSQACVNAACVGSCAPTQTRCESPAGYLVCDEAGVWGQLTSCGAAACSDGQCTGSCAPDSRRCKPGSLVAQRCTAQGIWEDSATCANQACIEGACSGECSPGRRECSAGGVRECSDQGSFGAVQACRDQACVNGNCTGVCAPATTRCNTAGEVETCSASGTWGRATACRDQACVNGACSGVCAPTNKRCASAGNRVEACDTSGAWQTFQQCSAPGEICRASRCVTNAPVNLGYADVTGWSARSLLDNRMYLLGPFDPGFAAEVLAINLIGSASNGASADMFVYQDEMGVPGKLRARASSTLLLTPDNASTDVRPVGTQIPAGGKVWIGAVFFGGAQLPQPTVTTFPTRAYVLSFTFGGAPPDPFPVKSAMIVNGAALPFFLTVREVSL